MNFSVEIDQSYAKHKIRYFMFLIFFLCLFCGGYVYSATKTVLILGDSLSAEYGLEKDSGWGKLLENRIHKSFPCIKVINASMSGETTRGGRLKLPVLLQKYKPSIVIIELGGNDGLRRLPVKTIQANLTDMISTVKRQKGKVLLLGMKIPLNYGQGYTGRFAEIYRSLAIKTNSTLVPFFLEKIAQDPNLFQDDKIHPNAQAQPILLQNVWPYLRPLLN